MSTKHVNKMLNNISSKVSQLSKKSNTPSTSVRQRKRRNRRRNRARRRFLFRSVPSAYASAGSMRSSYTKFQQNACRYSGRDLVFSPDGYILDPASPKFFAMIPMNPAYWTGTRVSGIAKNYQLFRPIKIVLHYVPIVGTSSTGTIFVGTSVSPPPFSSDSRAISSGLVTSNGGFQTTVYSKYSKEILSSTSLSQNNYRVFGKFDEENIPYWIYAYFVDPRSENPRTAPGFIYITYTFEFKNPIVGPPTFVRYFDSTPSYESSNLGAYSNVYFISNNDYQLEGIKYPAGTVFRWNFDADTSIFVSPNGTPISYSSIALCYGDFYAYGFPDALITRAIVPSRTLPIRSNKEGTRTNGFCVISPGNLTTFIAQLTYYSGARSIPLYTSGVSMNYTGNTRDYEFFNDMGTNNHVPFMPQTVGFFLFYMDHLITPGEKIQPTGAMWIPTGIYIYRDLERNAGKMGYNAYYDHRETIIRNTTPNYLYVMPIPGTFAGHSGRVDLELTIARVCYYIMNSDQNSIPEDIYNDGYDVPGIYSFVLESSFANPYFVAETPSEFSELRMYSDDATGPDVYLNQNKNKNILFPPEEENLTRDIENSSEVVISSLSKNNDRVTEIEEK